MLERASGGPSACDSWVLRRACVCAHDESRMWDVGECRPESRAFSCVADLRVAADQPASTAYNKRGSVYSRLPTRERPRTRQVRIQIFEVGNDD